jgi:hypothetical protein
MFADKNYVLGKTKTNANSVNDIKYCASVWRRKCVKFSDEESNEWNFLLFRTWLTHSCENRSSAPRARLRRQWHYVSTQYSLWYMQHAWDNETEKSIDRQLRVIFCKNLTLSFVRSVRSIQTTFRELTMGSSSGEINITVPIHEKDKQDAYFS